MGGMIFGDRITKVVKHMLFTDKLNQLRAIVHFGPKGLKANQLNGSIYQYDPNIVKLDDILKGKDQLI